ncbi:MAG: hypothetical protein PHP04_08195 [Bacteroidales bacterium]|nr:hypothetical protein [Bacteroidales bacterium]HPS51343.1 hypothetical protein [Bacteroidales bacterium]
MRTFAPLLMVVLILLGSTFPLDSYVDERTDTEIIFTPDGRIFPSHWYHPKINATAVPLAPVERNRFIHIINRAFAKYPDQVLREHLDRIYALKYMKFYGIPFGGTNVGNTVFISDDESNPSFTDSYIEGVFHHEFSSVLKRSFPAFLNSNVWEAVNEPTFTYGNGGVYAIRTGEASLALNPELYPSGFLTQYSQASVEEDINVFAQNLFSGEKSFWEIVERNPKIRRKAQLLIAFYQKIDSRFTESYFRRISHANPPKIMAGNRN